MSAHFLTGGESARTLARMRNERIKVLVERARQMVVTPLGSEQQTALMMQISVLDWDLNRIDEALAAKANGNGREP